jgi:CheY-like chemotaxis protein
MQPIRILIVDDNVDAASTLSMLLRSDTHQIETAYSGREALKTVIAFMPDIVFLDIGMPEMDGYEVARAIRGMPEAGNPVLVALTGWGGENDRRRSQEVGFNEHLTKPADVSVIYATLDRLTRG